MLSPEARELAAQVADLLETTYVPHEPISMSGMHCAITAINKCCLRNYRLANLLENYLRDHIIFSSISHWSDNAGKEKVIKTFRKIASN